MMKTETLTEFWGPTAAVLAAEECFVRDLPELMQTGFGRWVAYSGTERVGGFFLRQSAAYEYCRQVAGLTIDQFLVRKVSPLPKDDDAGFGWL
jgi:hypothetical protein